MRFSSSIKVGILTITALFILIFSIMWVKGRSLSSSERITVEFKDVNGMRPGSAVQIMGFRVGQVEEVIPVIDGENSYIKLKFVITEPNIEIPYASEISIQQSGLIGEQFLEITPPKNRIVYLPVTGHEKVLKKGNDVEMLLSDEYHKVGLIKNIEIIQTSTIPSEENVKISTEKAYKITYIINMPGLIIPNEIKAKILPSLEGGEKMRISLLNGNKMLLPETDKKYTIIEPMRLIDFMELQYKSAEALTETNEKISAILSEDVIEDLKETAKNLNSLSLRANTTLEKAELLIDTSKTELLTLTAQADKISDKIIKLTDNLNELAGNEDFVKNINDATKSVTALSNNLNDIVKDPQTRATLANINVMSKNLSEISLYVNDMSKDEKLKRRVLSSVDKLDLALEQLNISLKLVNEVGTDEKAKILSMINDASETSKNLKKFSEKLNKRFLLFRLMF